MLIWCPEAELLYPLLAPRTAAGQLPLCCTAHAPRAGQLPRFAAWVERCKLNAEGTLTLHDVWGMMLGGVKCEPSSLPLAFCRYS